MLILIAGIALFLGAHSLNIVAGGRGAWVERVARCAGCGRASDAAHL